MMRSVDKLVNRVQVSRPRFVDEGAAVRFPSGHSPTCTVGSSCTPDTGGDTWGESMTIGFYL